MAFILNIETATTVCSVSVSNNNELLAYKEIDNGFTHAENLHLFIETVLSEAKLGASQLSAIAVSKGPGSYTGLRIGVSAAKGLAYALQIPLISVDTLQVMAAAASEQKACDFYCPLVDARRMEVYTAVYNKHLGRESAVEALIADEHSIAKYKQYTSIAFFGDGMLKCKALLSELGNSYFIDNITPSAKFMPVLAFKKFSDNHFEDVAYFEPFYLKDFMILKKKGSIE